MDFANRNSEEGTTLFTYDTSRGLIAYDDSDPSNLLELGKLDNLGDKINLLEPTGIDSIITNDSVNIVAIATGAKRFDNEKTSVEDREDGIILVDVADASKMKIISTVDTKYAIDDLILKEVNNSVILFAVSQDNGVLIYNISVTSSPVLLGEILLSDDEAAFYDIYLVDELLFIAGGEIGAYIYNISYLRSPTLITKIIPDLSGIDESNSQYGSILSCLEISGDTLYLGDLYYGLWIYNITNVSSPQYLSRFSDESNICCIEIQGNMAHIIDMRDGIQEVDISNPKTPILKDQYDIYGEITNFKIMGENAYFTIYSGNFMIADISRIASDRVAGVFPSIFHLLALIFAGADIILFYLALKKRPTTYGTEI